MRTAWAVLRGSPGGLSWETTSAASGSGGHGVQPALEKGAGPEVAPAAHGPADVGIRADQHCQDRLQGFGVKVA